MKSKEITYINNYKKGPTITALLKLLCLSLKISSLTNEQQCETSSQAIATVLDW